ncbi:hypothetical protein C0992_001062 [Termitomyces sp. T32_za158]|nr:hypothetical protein C0992_001062 [Termitomyces sp. T32_za158]
MSSAAVSSSSPSSSLTASTFVAKVDLFLARIKGLGVGAPQPLVLSGQQLLACWEALKSAGVEWKRRGELLSWCWAQRVEHLGAEWLLPFETLLVSVAFLSWRLALILSAYPLGPRLFTFRGNGGHSGQGAYGGKRRCSFRPPTVGCRNSVWQGRSATGSDGGRAEQVRAAVAARERRDKKREEKKAACRAAAAQEGGDKGETDADNGTVAGAGADASGTGAPGAEVPGTGTGDGAAAGADAPAAGADVPGAGFHLQYPTTIGTWSKGAGTSSPKRHQTGGASSLAPSVGKGKAPEQGTVRPKSHQADMPKQTTFSDDELRELLVSRCKEVKLDLGVAAGVVIDEVKGKTTVAPAQRRAYKALKGVCDRCWAENDPEGCWFPAGVLPCLCCDSLKKPCTYDGLKSRERGKANKAIERTFQKAILVRRARGFVEAQRVVKATGEAPAISDLSLALPMGQGGESVSMVAEEEVEAPTSQHKDKGKGKVVAKGSDGDKAKKWERPLTGDQGAPRKRQALDEFGAGPSGHRDPSAVPLSGGRPEIMVPAPAWRPVQDWERQLAAARKATEEDREAEAKAKEKEGEEKTPDAPPMGTPAPCVSVHQMPVPTPRVTAEDFAWLGEDLKYPVSAFTPPSDLEALIGRELAAVDTEMSELQARRQNLFCSVEILRRYQEDCEAAMAWQKHNNV